MQTQTKPKGMLSRLRGNLERNRLGELLVGHGHINDAQLDDALRIQKVSGLALGEVLRDQGLITTTDLRVTLCQQLAWRSLAAMLALVVGFSAMGATSARATSARMETGSVSAPEGGTLQQVSIDRRSIPSPAAAYPPLFNTSEVRSADISPFTKFTGILARLNPSNSALPGNLSNVAQANEMDRVEAVNTYFNRVRYIEDKNNWGTSDYWETPQEFVSRGGDCEDFAIAKYTALRQMGFKESQLRIAIVQDTWKNIPHAILIVYTSQGAKFLDNQYKEVKTVAGFDRYRPVYSINSTGWWRHV